MSVVMVPSLMANRKALKSVLKSALLKYPSSEVFRRSQAAGVTHGPVQPMF